MSLDRNRKQENTSSGIPHRCNVRLTSRNHCNLCKLQKLTQKIHTMSNRQKSEYLHGEYERIYNTFRINVLAALFPLQR